MSPVLWLTRNLSAFNAAILTLGRSLGVVCVAVMVVFILIQVFCRYVLGNALPWSEEGARFLMLWMTGLMAPSAFRRGGFVSIDMLVLMMPKIIAALLQLVLLFLSLAVLVVGFKIGWAEVTGFSGRFATDALWVPTKFDLSEWMKVPRAWAMASLATGITLLILVNVELILRSFVQLMGATDELPEIADRVSLGAE
ncbi:MAG: TRAP-type C4-dicarboxylate transport system permease small subunit [Pseudorhodobacter sp.]|jgi:TRAP-type C4-dicarboxylate transport system permease small subunit